MSGKMKTKLLISLILLGLVDVVIPIPIVCIVLIYVICEKPPWFRGMVRDIYGD
jgi:hypothetical protein